MKHIFYIMLVCVVVIAPTVVYAVAPPSALGNISNRSDAGNANESFYTATGIATIITDVVNWFSWIVALASVVMGLYAGFLFITARGEPAQLKTARGRFCGRLLALRWRCSRLALSLLPKRFSRLPR